MRILLSGFLAAALFLSSPEAKAQGIDPNKAVDLTYSFNKDTIYWPNAKGFAHRKDEWKVTPAGFWYAAGGFSTDEHGGTHFDSPVHFGQGKLTLDQIPVSRLIAPAAVIDISAASAKNRDYRSTPQDIQAWEKANGLIGAGTIVVFRTGWGKRWPNKKEYLGDDKPGDIEHLHFPGLSKEVAELLVARKVDGVGIDTASMDYGPSKDFIVHQILNKANIFGLENVANADKLPVKGATIIALPMKIEEGSGGPARIIALLP
ncbi:MAG: cyclase family protein [Bryobacteraceae bacterium]